MLPARRALAIFLICAGAAAAAILLLGTLSDIAAAQGNPFGAPRAAPPDGIVGGMLAKQ